MIPQRRLAAAASAAACACLLLMRSTSAFTAHRRRPSSPRTAFSARSNNSLRPSARPASALDPSRVVVALRSSPPSVDPSSSQPEQSSPPSDGTIRGRLRRITGFSLTAFRATMRATTGFSLTALRATLRAATGISVTGTMKWILGLFPTWFRYFLQPFLVLYYAPLMILRSWVGPTETYRAEALAAHERVVESWKDAIRAAEGAQEGGYWPVHVDDEGNIVASLPPEPDLILGNVPADHPMKLDASDIAEAVFESVEYAESHKLPETEEN